MAQSFPWPLPVGTDPADGLCSNRSRIDARLCTPPEVEQYYKVRHDSWMNVGQWFGLGGTGEACSCTFGCCSPEARHEHTPLPLHLRMQFMLLTENPEKIPDNQHCAAGAADQPACSPGFFDAAPVRGAQPQQPHACCDGYFCPAELTCMIPCPIGAYCPRYKSSRASLG